MATAKKPAPKGITKPAPITKTGRVAPPAPPKAPAKPPVPALQKGGALSTEDFNAKMAALVAQTKRAEAPSGGFISFKDGITIGGTPVPSGKFRAVIVQYHMYNQHYNKPYNPMSQTISVPACWAAAVPGSPLTPWREERENEAEVEMIRDEATGLVTEAEEPQVEPGVLCADCPNMEWGSAPPKPGTSGKGKACSETRRINFIMEANTGTPADVAQAPIFTAVPPATSLENFKGLMNDISDNLGAPCFAVVVEVERVSHPRWIFQINYTVVEVIKDEPVLYALMQRHEALNAKAISMPKPDEAAAPPAPADRRGKKF